MSTSDSTSDHGTMDENYFIKAYWIRRGFEVESDLLQTKNRNISRYQSANLLKTWFLFLICKKGQKEDKSEFVTKSVGIVVTIIFSKTFATRWFFTDPLNHKTVNKIKCKASLANRRQL